MNLPVQNEGPDQAKTTVACYTSILQEHDVFQAQREKRLEILKDIARAELNDGDGPNSVVVHLSRASLSGDDIPVLGNILLGIGDVKTLNLILNSPGGDGTVVEKFVDLCRSQCENFRVIVPNEAKSAATLIALGADEIIMGPPSELGPIDAQIEAVVNGVRRYISAQSFIDTRDNLVKQYFDQIQNGKDTGATTQMIATLDLPFITECERLMAFGRDVAGKLLSKYMFKGKSNKAQKIAKAVDTLSSVERFMVHGRMLDGRTARTELGLKVSLRGKNDELWQKVWEYYTRAEIVLGKGGVYNFFETEDELLMATPLTKE